MAKSLSFFLIILSLHTIIYCCVHVRLSNGIIKGRIAKLHHKNGTFYAFQQIPYAAPPIGNLRFQPPQPVLKWPGVLDTTKNTKVCYQVGTNTDQETEDCLYLNVYTPQLPKNAENLSLPVIVYIHGGGFILGDATHQNWGPEFLIPYEVVVVTLNYRVGVFGFLSTQDHVVPGNNGLKDQLFALQWVQKNIHLFGGDSTKVTLMGQSAGAAAVGYHLLSQKSKGVYRAAIMESGSSISAFGYQKNARYYAAITASFIDPRINQTSSSEAILNVLFTADAALMDQITENVSVDTIDNVQLFQGYCYAPVLEVESSEAFLTEKMFEMIERGDADRVPTLIGVNSEEGLGPQTDLDFLKRWMSVYDGSLSSLVPHNMNIDNQTLKEAVGAEIRRIYSGDGLMQDKAASGIRYMSDTTFTRSVIKYAQMQSAYADVYFYQFSYDGMIGNVSIIVEDAERVGHNEENGYLWRIRSSMFDNYDLSIYPQSDLITQQRLLTLWTNFVKYLNPTPEPTEIFQNIIWPTVSFSVRGDHPYLDIGKNLEIKYYPKQQTYDRWVALYEEYGIPPYTTY